jgi:hypothetical protein
MKIPVYLFNKPSNISMVAAALSFLAWAFPRFGMLRKGFDKAAELDPVAILILAAWYMLIFFSFRVGQFFGTAPGGKYSQSPAVASLDANLPYYAFTIIAAVGVLAATVKVFGSLSFSAAFDFILSGNANAMKEAIYDDYQIGLLSLRYVEIYPAAIALYRLATRRRLSLSIVINLMLLLVCVLLSSRLMLIATLVTFFLLMNYNIRLRSVRLSRVVVLGALLFSLLAVFNYSRNFGFYEERGLSFWSSGFAEIITYLGGSTQVALGTAARTSDLVSSRDESYRELVDIEEQLNAPSAFVMLHQNMGYLCWLYMAVVCGTGGFVFSLLVAKGKTMYLLPCGAVLYSAADLWRINFFGQGIFIVLMVIGTGVPWFLSVVVSLSGGKELKARVAQ